MRLSSSGPGPIPGPIPGQIPGPRSGHVPVRFWLGPGPGQNSWTWANTKLFLGSKWLQTITVWLLTMSHWSQHSRWHSGWHLGWHSGWHSRWHTGWHLKMGFQRGFQGWLWRGLVRVLLPRSRSILTQVWFCFISLELDSEVGRLVPLHYKLKLVLVTKRGLRILPPFSFNVLLIPQLLMGI